MTSLFNVIVIALILLVFILILFFLFKKDISDTTKLENRKDLQLSNLIISVEEIIKAIQNTNISELHLNETETKKREELKYKLDHSLRYACTGDIGSKEYLKEYIAELLLNNFKINEININYVVPFVYEKELTIMQKFGILQYQFRKLNKDGGFGDMVDKYSLFMEKEDQDGKKYYSLDEDEIEYVYSKERRELTFVEKLDSVSQWIYQAIAGHGVIDMLREDKSIDSICGGVSGLDSGSYNYEEEELLLSNKIHGRHDSIWVVFRGKTGRLKFMTFGDKSELQRVTHNLYRNGNAGWMSSIRGYVLNDTKDGDRVTTSRPPFSESFGFFIRKFGTSERKTLDKLIKGVDSEIAITIIKTIMKGGCNVVFSGFQDCGKTTLLKSAIGELDDRDSIRTIEPFLEMWLSRLYPEKNIMAFRALDNIPFSEAISVMKKSTGNIMIAGESADHTTAASVVELGIVGTKSTYSTCHPREVDDLISYHANSVMAPGIGLYSDDKRAELAVAKALNVDVHMNKTKSGFRYVERITEIIPSEDRDIVWPDDLDECTKLYYKLSTKQKMYTTRDIVVYKDNKYQLVNQFSENLMKRIHQNIEDMDLSKYELLINERLGVVK